MKGTTHLAIGAAIGTGAAFYFPFQWNHAAVYFSVAAFSALAADLDGPSLLHGKLSRLSRWIDVLGLWLGLLLLAGSAYMYFSWDRFYPVVAAVAVVILVFGLITSQGTIRNALVSLVGIGFLYAGIRANQTWLIGLGAFIAWVPWLKHRGMTHTVWALVLWGAIGWEMEKQLHVEGVMMTSVIGYASHLLADTFTPLGVKWLFPLYKRSIKFVP